MDALVSIAERPSVAARSDISGRFELPPVRETQVVPPFADAVYLGCCSRGTISVKADGYRELTQRIEDRAPDSIELSLKLERH
jgi:hypothetical protein